MQGRAPLGDQRLTRIGRGRDLSEPGLQSLRVPAADQTAQDAVRLAGRGIQWPGVEIGADIGVDDVRGNLPPLGVCLTVWKIQRS